MENAMSFINSLLSDREAVALALAFIFGVGAYISKGAIRSWMNGGP